MLGDGAPWIWNLADKHFSGATQIVDLYHAKEHVHALAALLAPTLGDSQPAWLADRLAELDSGDIAALLTAGRALELPDAEREQADKALGYFQTNAHRMRYAQFREQGHFVGPGAVEAGCKAVIGQRLKLSGMRWTVRGAPASRPCAAKKPADAGTKSGKASTLRPTRPDLATHKSGAHPSQDLSSSAARFVPSMLL